MNREIKFRAWGRSNEFPEGRMYYAGTLPLVVNLYGDLIHAPDGTPIDKAAYMRVGWNDVALMQYTGLKDKSGVGIYEGDVVKVGKQGITSVTFFEGCFYTVTAGGNYRCGGWEKHAIEVIGNIYENPELVETENEQP